ncbi:DUF3081 family protein [Parashewanella curva]|uniref:DUF3081 family protein n=1 Tax=Parashewanella curva TaxID=2338552 RepID=A0A3L8PUL9_9GAMM|nr:DUF3081 family protein [Parashewanella curva]
MRAWYDFDGYTCYLQYNQLIMTLQFHGKYRLEYPNKEDLHQFEAKLAKICAKL